MINYKKNIYYTSIAAMLLFTGCLKDETNLPEQNAADYYQVYMPLAVQNPYEISLKYDNEGHSFVYGANYGGLNYPDKDISVEFAVAPGLVDSFNQKNGTSYPVLPANAYEFTKTSAIIPAGKLATEPLEIKVTPKGNMDLLKTYLLPVSLSVKGNDYKLNESLKTTFYLVTASL